MELRSRDFANILLVLLKFLLALAIGLQSSLGQLGLNGGQTTGLVNTTPLEQTSVEGRFTLSFYPVVFAPGVDLREVSIDVTAWQCWWECDLTSVKFDRETRLPGNWKRLDTRSFEPYREASGPREEASEPHEAVFKLKGPQEGSEPHPDTYRIVYRVSISVAGISEPHWQHASKKGFSVSFRPEEEGDWRLPPVQIVRGRGRRGDLPPQLGRIKLILSNETDLEIDGARFSLRDPRRAGNSLEEEIRLNTKVERIHLDEREIEVDILAGRIDVEEARFLKYDRQKETYFVSKFSELQVGHAIHIELKRAGSEGSPPPSAEIVRFGEEVPAKLTVVVLENVPPGPISLGRERRGGLHLHFPVHAYRQRVRQGERRVWFFNLDQFIIDPDGASTIQLGSGKISRGDRWTEGYEIDYFEAESINILKLDTSRLRRASNRATRDSYGRRVDRLEIRVSDDWNSIKIPIRITYMTADELDFYKIVAGFLTQ